MPDFLRICRIRTDFLTSEEIYAKIKLSSQRTRRTMKMFHVEHKKSKIPDFSGNPESIRKEVTNLSFIIENGILRHYRQNRFTPETKIIIPGGVTEISAFAFDDCREILSVQMPGTVRKIGNSAFGFCENLQSIRMSRQITEIEGYAFHACENLRAVVIPENLTVIREFTFCKCTSLQAIRIPEQIGLIDIFAFWGCESLETILIPGQVRKIKEAAFQRCRQLKTVRIRNHPGQIRIAPDAFADCHPELQIIYEA